MLVNRGKSMEDILQSYLAYKPKETKPPAGGNGSNGDDTEDEEETTPPNPGNRILLAPATSLDPKYCIILPSGKYGKHDYPEMLIGMQRLSYNAEVQAVNQRKGWPHQNTAKGASQDHAYDFIGNINHASAKELNRELGNVTLSLVLGREFLKHIQRGINSRRYKVYDGDKNQVGRDKLREVFSDSVEVKDPWRAEWYDTTFHQNGSQQWTVTYPIFKTDHWEYTTEDLEECLMKDRVPGIDLKDWLKNATSQGLPLPGAELGRRMYYWHPINGSVVGLYAGSDWLRLGCNRNPAYTVASLGVRAARAKI